LNTILVTGGAGFIGSNLVRQLIKEDCFCVVNLDKLTYAGNLNSLNDLRDDCRHIFMRADITDKKEVNDVFESFQPYAVINLAAESHVDRSVDSPDAFIQTNIIGTFNLLEISRHYLNKCTCPEFRKRFRFLQVSTDEVYGSLGAKGFFTEDSRYAPNSPYSASKAAADHLARSYFHTYGLPVITTNCSNNYGPFQFPEKLIPLMILKATEGSRLPVYGDGSNVRDWLYVEDHCRALRMVLKSGKEGEVYNIGGSCEKTNLEVVNAICDLLDLCSPLEDERSYKDQIAFVGDRPGHDKRYAVDANKIRRELGWMPEETFETGLAKTVKWYLENGEWLQHVSSGKYRGERLGVLNHE